MNAIKCVEECLTTDLVDSDLYISKKNGHKYRFIEPASFQYQGECAWYEDLETGKKELVYGGDLESLARRVPNKFVEEITKTLYMEQKFTGLNRNRFNTLYISTKNIILKDKELDIEIDMSDKIEKISRIIIDGIIFEKKEN